MNLKSFCKVVDNIFERFNCTHCLPLTLSICEGREFIERPARYKCPIENIKLKLTTKSQIETRLPEPLLMLAYG